MVRLLWLAFNLITVVVKVGAFNLDWAHPTIFGGGNLDRSYFGFTVGLLRNSQGTWALVGAPRAASSYAQDYNVNEPGVIFKCSIQSQRCGEILFQTRVPPYLNDKLFSYIEKRDNGFLGMSLDIGDHSKPNVVACAHLWKNTVYSSDRWLANGICYLIDSELNLATVRTLLPLVDRSQQYRDEGKTNFYSTGMAGFSTHFLAKSDSLVMGAPGLNNFTGSIIYTRKSEYLTRNRQTFHIPHLNNKYDDDSYTGYSLTSGELFGDGKLYMVAGAPRANLSGNVYIVDTMNLPVKFGFNPQLTLTGHQMGENFGSSVCAVDFNNDRLADLLVGAPMHHNVDIDEGKVYVYTTTAEGLLILSDELLGSKKIGARFGSAITNVGNLDQDQFEDVAIGAPYEDDIGAVYIYSGSRKGLHLTQRIVASEVNNKLRGFGFSISRGLDIDGNFYSDLAIGSYDSGHAVILKSYPVVTMQLSLKFNQSQIDLNDTSCRFQNQPTSCFSISACVHFQGENLPKQIAIASVLMVGTHNHKDFRAFLATSTQPTHEIKETITVTKSSQCRLYIAHVQNDTKDILRPVSFTLKTELLKNPLKEKNFCDDCFLIRPGGSNSTSKSISFVTNCGSDGICNFDLQAKAFLDNFSAEKPYVLGSSPYVTLMIEVENLGHEPAYSSEVNIVLPPQVSVVSPDSSCGEIIEQLEGDITDCEIKSLLNPQEKTTIKMKLDLSDLKMPLESIRFAVNVSTENSDKNIDDNVDNNVFNLDIPVRTDADITIAGSADVEQFIVKSDETNKDSLNSTIVHHLFKVWKEGQSRIESVTLDIKIPSGATEPFVKILLAEYDMSGISDLLGTCEGDISSALTGRTPGEYAPPPQNVRVLRSLHSTSMDSVCSNTKCLTVRCRFGPFIKDEIASVKLKLEVALLPLSSVMKKKDSFSLVSWAWVKIDDHEFVQPSGHKPDEDKAITEFLNGQPQAKELPDWIIPLCIVAGIILLLVVTLVLWKVGFFRRKEKEEMEKLTSCDSVDDVTENNS